MNLPNMRPGTQVVSRLRFTFLFIVAMLTVAVTIGSIQLFSLWRSQENLLTESIPALIQTEELVRELTALLAITAQLGDRQTPDRLLRLQETIDEHNAALRNAIASIPNAGSVAPIREEFIAVQRRLEKAVTRLLSLRQEILPVRVALNENVDGLKDIRSEIADITEPLLIDAAIAVEHALDGSGEDPQAKPPEARTAIAAAVSLLNALNELVFQINLSIDGAEQLSLMTEAAQKSLATKRLQFEFRTIAQLILRLKDDERRQSLARTVRKLREIIFGSDGISQNLLDLETFRDRFQSAKERQLELHSDHLGDIDQARHRREKRYRRDRHFLG